MADSTLIVGVTGIVVSGIVGPGIAAWFSQRSQIRGFNRGQAAGRRDALRILLDDAAVLLATGATNLRILQEGHGDPIQLQGANEWMTQVFPIGQRLQLWLPHDDPVVVAYEKVRHQLVTAGESGRGEASEQSLVQFEEDRREFLDVARAKLLEPISALDGAE
jgi:hypothetical protein